MTRLVEAAVNSLRKLMNVHEMLLPKCSGSLQQIRLRRVRLLRLAECALLEVRHSN